MDATPTETSEAAGEALLAIWTSITGTTLSPVQRQQFLVHRAVPKLVTYPLAALTTAGIAVHAEGHMKLSHWLRQLEPRKSSNRSTQPVPTTPVWQGDAPGSPTKAIPPPRSTKKSKPLYGPGGMTQAPVDAALHKMIGSTQRYDN